MRVLIKKLQHHKWQLTDLLWLLLFFLPFERIPSFNLLGVTVRISLVIGLLLIGGVVLSGRLAVGDFKAKPWRWAWVYLFVVLLAALAGMHPARGLEIVGFDAYVILLAMAVSKLIRVGDLPTAKKWLLTSAVIVSIFALYQFVGDLIGLPIKLTGLRPDYTKAIFGFPRVQSTLLEPLYFANYLLLPLAIIAALVASGQTGLAALILFFTCTFLTVSRGGQVADAVLLVLLLVDGVMQRRLRQTLRVVATAVIGVLIAVLAITRLVPVIASYQISHGTKVNRETQADQNYQNQVTNYDVGNSNDDRTRTRNLAWQIFKSHPLIGVGPGGFGYVAHNAYPRDYSIKQTANNLPLEVLAETGILGAAFLGLFAVSVIWLGLSSLMFLPASSLQRTWLLGLLIFLVGTAVQYQTFSTLYITSIWTALGLLVGLAKKKDGAKSV